MTRRLIALALFVLPFVLWAGLALAVEDAAVADGVSVVDEAAPVQIRRYALVVGVNDGGPDRVQLRYAGTDAQALGRVLTQIGGVQPEDAVVLLDVDRDGLSEGLDRVAAQLASAEEDVRTELFFYYSGHSDEQGLLLGGERVGYSDLREALDSLPADVRIAILDSCASGAFTRLKGGTRRTPFLVDSTGDVRGHAFLTSSSEDEASQESDRLQGSFFTYALISGLRGAADQTGDGRVSLNEVYQFAFHETLRRTESTLGGPQHPAYDIQLAGSGDLVLTDLREVSATLELAEAVDGRVSIRNSDDRLELELRKFAGRAVTLGLESGGYTVVWDDGVRVREAVIWLGEGVDLQLRSGDFTERSVEHTVERGDAPGDAHAPQNESIPGARVHPGEQPAGPGAPGKRTLNLRKVPVNVSLVPPLDINTWVKGPDLNHVSLFVLGGRSDVVEGVSWGVGFGWVGEMRGVQGAFVNWANTLDGVQVGVVNMATEARGAQVGMVNIAGTMDGVMVGMVNIAEDAKVAIGLLNFIKRGIFHVDVFASDTGLINVGVKFGARHTYTRFTGGFSPFGDGNATVEVGIGVRLPRKGPLILDLDGGSGLVFGVSGWKTPSFKHQLRAVLNVRLAKHFGLFVGPTLNVLVGPPGRDPATGRPDANTSSVWEMRDNGSGISFMPTATGDLSNVRVQVWPGGVVGFSF
ncbi:MAG: caspase family protein [Deltaproteobacteria bacterium]|nr:caspase family protein [Deltaproteobacteria bacterium]